MNVLILSAGRRVELIQCFKKARDRLNIRGKIIAADITSTAPAVHFADEWFRLPRIAHPDYLPSLIKNCIEHKVSLVVPTIDTELEILAANRSRIEKETGAKVMISDAEAVSVCCNKIKTAQFFKEHGFLCPDVIDDVRLKTGNYTFPLFIKPLNGSSSINAFRVKNQRELEFFKEYIENPIIQQCVTGREYTIDCFSDFNAKVITVVPRERLATRSGEILKGRIDKNRAIIDEAKKLVAAFGFIGHTTIQGFLGEDGRMRYIEINPRFGGGAPMSIAVGADSCKNLYRLLRGERLEYNENYEDGVYFSRFDSSIRVNTDD